MASKDFPIVSPLPKCCRPLHHRLTLDAQAEWSPRTPLPSSFSSWTENSVEWHERVGVPRVSSDPNVSYYKTFFVLPCVIGDETKKGGATIEERFPFLPPTPFSHPRSGTYVVGFWRTE
ncbi:MAG: hypothetical protein BJ554DRAFT_5719 [Olpidium bornovanus]|uniref:Uncharacterized protein n=1 Tax=Olpidium bornovanus TaxID=278681 RepID=A0A8H8DKT7_9FUNG|nr:MAG: hypothetical protein BJ554DRAFT_5719 [Olpidium bornovanus]